MVLQSPIRIPRFRRLQCSHRANNDYDNMLIIARFKRQLYILLPYRPNNRLRRRIYTHARLHRLQTHNIVHTWATSVRVTRARGLMNGPGTHDRATSEPCIVLLCACVYDLSDLVSQSSVRATKRVVVNVGVSSSSLYTRAHNTIICSYESWPITVYIHVLGTGTWPYIV